MHDFYIIDKNAAFLEKSRNNVLYIYSIPESDHMIIRDVPRFKIVVATRDRKIVYGHICVCPS